MSSTAAKSYGIEVRGHGVPADCSWPPSAAWQHAGLSSPPPPPPPRRLRGPIRSAQSAAGLVWTGQAHIQKNQLQKSRSNKIFIHVCGGLIYSSAEMIHWLIQFTDHFLFLFFFPEGCCWIFLVKFDFHRFNRLEMLRRIIQDGNEPFITAATLLIYGIFFLSRHLSCDVYSLQIASWTFLWLSRRIN